MLLCYVFTVKLEQIWAHLCEGKQAFFSELRLRLHFRYTVSSLIFLTDFNRIAGSIVFAFFLTLYPENAVNCIAALKGFTKFQPMSFLTKVIIQCSAVGLLVFITILHYFMIGLTRRIFQSAKSIMAVSVHSKSIRDSKTRLKLERYIDLFYSIKKPHTVTYGRHGNVTKASFGKV